jgi:hypothetical protein
MEYMPLVPQIPQEEPPKKTIEDIFAQGNDNVIENWNTIPDEPKELKQQVLDRLILERALSSADIEGMVRVSEGSLGGLANSCIKGGYYADTLFDPDDILLKRIEPKSLSQETFDALRDDGGKSSTIQYAKKYGLFQDTVNFE